MEAKNNARWETGPREQIRFIKHTCHFDSQACGVVLEWLRMLYQQTTASLRGEAQTLFALSQT